MAIHNPSNLYSGGAVTFNSQPEVNLYANVLARQQAKMEAMDNYERSRINSVNENGVRDIDRKTMDNQLRELQEYYGQNKDKIRKGNSQEAFDYEKKFRDIKDLVAGSKERSVRHDAAMKFYNERLKQDQRLPEDFITELSENDKAIGDKYVDEITGEEREYKPFDITKWASTPPAFDQSKFIKNFSDLKRTGGNPRYENVEGNPLKLTQIVDETFDDDSKKVIAARAADKYENSYSFSTQVQNELKDPVRRKELGDLFQKEYGVEPSMPSDYAIAYTMELLQPKISKSSVIDNKEEITKRNQAFQREMTEKRHQNSLTRLYANARVQDRKPENIQRNIDGIIADHITSSRSNNGQVLVDDDTFEAITGRKKSGSSVLIIDEQGNYSYGKKDGETGTVQITGTIPYELAKTKLTKEYKSGLDSKFNTGDKPPDVKLPKDIKKTRIKVNW